ncbi:urea transporter [Phyllobacterium phragmitis]|uniref:Urea transporter n=1 Tax=Phyllobacterium phragmitis TaxID=2670329 RepID=A0A2S9IWF7_9HYPH|nr:urea transporter [Phyllobacterium phragmitis]PRD44866.1 urea transporter [Phyllobacterium phragmitis]
MEQLTAWWNEAVGRSYALKLLDMHMRGASQVMLQNNVLTGLLFILGIFWGAAAAGNLSIAIGAIVGLVIATLTAILLRSDEASLEQGLFGFNGILVGVAVPTFLVMGPATWFLLIIGAAFSTIAMLAISHVTKLWGVPALTFPFVLTTWFLVLAAYSFGHLPIGGMGPPALPSPLAQSAPGIDLSASVLLSACIRGISQVFLINNFITGIIFIAALLVSSRWAAAFAVAGSVVSVIVALVLGANPSGIGAGLYGFSPVLTAIALGSVFFEPSWRVALFALLGTIVSVIAQGALDTAIAPLGVPTFTAAFVFVTWLFLLPKLNLKPHGHEPVSDGIMTGK